MMPADEGAYAALARKISRGAGLSLEAYKDKCIRRRIAVRMRACGVHSYADYHALLDRSPGEYERLRDALTINVTRFYRNAETWALVRRTIIPLLCGAELDELHAWSAGCSSGEEPYTLAVLIADHLDRAGRPEQFERVTIHATDVDRESLDRARTARYRLDSLAEMPGELLHGYFEPVGTDYRVVERVRRRVRVQPHDMTDGGPPRHGYHLILCRNVLIYFDRPVQERIFLGFADALAPGGYLVLGKVETLLGSARDRLTLVDPRERVYRRVP